MPTFYRETPSYPRGSTCFLGRKTQDGLFACFQNLFRSRCSAFACGQGQVTLGVSQQHVVKEFSVVIRTFMTLGYLALMEKMQDW